MENYKNFIIEEMNKAHILVAKAEQIKRNRKLAETELEEVYRKAEAFDEIVNELLYQLQNLESWNTLDQKDCQTLKQILEENIKEEKQLKRYKVKRTITTEEVRYIDAETEEGAWYSVEYEDEGADTAHYNAEYGTWSYEEEEND
ncbi:hypothetical protein C5023_000028 [Staphylococcus phage vB_SauM_0414_108]|nr:hypothetical protein C5023_000028 [Staphylococcus phage vB_SauM_0414_108]